MTKTLIALGVLAISSSAFAAEKTANGGEKHSIGITTNTSAGEKMPATDLGDVSTKANRDFVANPTGVSVGGNLGFGTGDGYGLGLGARGGYTFTNRLYVGGLGAYHFGGTTSAADVSIRKSSWYLGPEVGYDLGAGALIVRPVLGLGLGFSTNDTTVNASNNNDTTPKLFISPGAEVMYPVGNFFVGGDARYMYMRGNDGLVLMANGGLHL